jgi:hypothetical protein
MAGQVVQAVPPSLGELNQKGLLERAFHDGLYPNLAFRAEAMPEEWPANTGQELFMTRAGLLKPSTKPLPVGTDPVGQAVPYEQWAAYLAQFGDSIDTHMPTATTANANLLLRNIKQLGLQAGQSINRIARDALFQAYLQGQTVNIATIASTDTQIRVAALNGFTEVVIPGSNVRPQPVSTSFPLPITIGSVGVGPGQLANTVVGFVPDDPTDPIGPGTLQLGAAVGAVFPLRAAVKSAFAPIIVRSAAGDSIDAIGPGDTLTLQQCINAVAQLRRANVQPHPDGFYHAHVSPLANAQFFTDPVFQRLNQSLPEHVIYKEGFLGYMSGIMFFMNTESPEAFNSGNLIATANSGVFADELGAEVVNGTGVNIGRVIITGRGAIYEKYLDESQYVTEAGTLGKIGEFNIVNNGIQVSTERIRLVLRGPIDKLHQVVTSTWSVTTSFPIPSDLTAPSGPQRYKRATVLEFAL